MTASHLFKDLTVCCDKLGLKRKKLAVVVDNGCPNLTGKNKDKVTYMNPELNWYFCIVL